jgi:hypothetical protein
VFTIVANRNYRVDSSGIDTDDCHQLGWPNPFHDGGCATLKSQQAALATGSRMPEHLHCAVDLYRTGIVVPEDAAVGW